MISIGKKFFDIESVEELKKIIKEEEDRLNKSNKDYDSYSVLYRAQKILELVEGGCDVKEMSEGIFVNDKYIVAINENKWRVHPKKKWYRYKSIPDFIERYVNEHKKN